MIKWPLKNEYLNYVICGTSICNLNIVKVVVLLKKIRCKRVDLLNAIYWLMEGVLIIIIIFFLCETTLIKKN